MTEPNLVLCGLAGVILVAILLYPWSTERYKKKNRSKKLCIYMTLYELILFVVLSMIYHKRLKLPYYKIGRKIFVDTIDVASYIEEAKSEVKTETRIKKLIRLVTHQTKNQGK